MIAKVFSGVISDQLAKRKMPAVFGYGLAALSKPLFPLANGVGLVLAARFVDRIGKGIRGAAFGLRQSLDTVGAFLGPVLAMLGMWWLLNDIRSVLWLSVLPALLSVVVLIYAVK